jgi:hypothetical protein
MTKQRFVTPVGRLVQGSVDEPQVKDAQGNLRVVKTGPNVGQPNPQFFIGVAFAKTDPAFNELWGLLRAKAAEDFPNLFPQGAAGACVHPAFAFKVIDGDGLDQSGKSNATKEGFAGHWVVRFASAYPPRCFRAGRYGAHEQIQEKGAIKRGYFVRVSGTVEGNANAQRPGLYVNLDMIELAAYGPEIVSGPDAGEAFGTGPVALPAGASAAPLTPPAQPAAPGAPALPPTGPAPAVPVVAPSPAAALPAPANLGPQRPTDPTHIHAAGTAGEQWWINGAWVPAAAPPAAPPAPAAPALPPAQPAPPYTGYMAPPAPGAPPASPTPAPAASLPPPVPGPASSATASLGNVMLPAANGATYEQMIAAGWTDDTLRAHGMMQ